VFSQNPECGEAPFGMSSLEIYSIFVESAKNKDYYTALLYGPWLMCAHPKKMEELPAYEGHRTFDRMIDVYAGFAEQQDDPSLKTAYMDSAIQIFDKMLDTFDNEEYEHFKIYLDRGRFFQKNADFVDNAYGKAYADYESMFNENPEKATELADGYYVQITMANLVSSGEREKVLKMIELASPNAGEKLISYFDKVQDDLFKDPTERIGFIKGKLAESPEDLSLLTELYELYEGERMIDEAKEMALKLYQLQPNYDNTTRMGDNAAANANYTEAIKFYKEAVDKAETDDQRKQLDLKIADNYINVEDLKKAREYARAASKIDPNWGQPYLKMAKIYSQAVSSCGKIEREDKVVYWLVLDYLEKAKRVDPSTTNFANQQIKSIGAVTPTTEEMFFKGWQAGASIEVDGTLKKCYDWIKETTTVRKHPS
jgi:tetratricopeptide (TPR) repeat protein